MSNKDFKVRILEVERQCTRSRGFVQKSADCLPMLRRVALCNKSPSKHYVLNLIELAQESREPDSFSTLAHAQQRRSGTHLYARNKTKHLSRVTMLSFVYRLGAERTSALLFSLLFVMFSETLNRRLSL